MEIIKNIFEMQGRAKDILGKNLVTGFVPTMGALHEGHLSLVRRSQAENDVTVVSIFVNPTQFGTGEDYDSYPRVVEEDLNALKALDTNILFLPEKDDIYSTDFNTFIEVKGVTENLCGAFRPGHFRGVTTVVNKLFNLVKPVRAYFGQKDFQQVVVIKKMVNDLNMDTEVIACPTVREEDGLAKSSRNLYLNADERKDASILYEAMKSVAEGLQNGDIDFQKAPHKLVEVLCKMEHLKEIQYASLYDPFTLEEVTDKTPEEYKKRELLIAVSLILGKTRLIDNLLVDL